MNAHTPQITPAPAITLSQVFAAGPEALTAYLDSLKPEPRPFRLKQWQIDTIAKLDASHLDGLLETYSRAHFHAEFERIEFRLTRNAAEAVAINARWERDRDMHMAEAWAEYALAVIDNGERGLVMERQP